ncbi:aspartyl protease family protein [Flavobacterium paronense]|uniref:Aspartyl protease family protein n=1 Tax=Flavobacterium paronense TaxID=1392775 RepID=A0ABV5GDC5_9FLAO|nr:aspartyl protease family protein [Flavobacterium paronense]MDN3677530.1 aspartyl protease family protein [Flavobacterium paronense]
MRLKLLFFFLFFSVYGFSQSEFQINNLKKKVVIPFKLINNLIFIPVTINGEELTFLLDTGVEQTILFSLDDKDEVKLFDVEKLKLKGLGSKDAVDSYKSSKNKVAIKDFVDYNHEIYIVLDQEFNFSSQVGIPVNGIIGYNFFRKHIVEINYDRKKIIVYDHSYKNINNRFQKKFIKEFITVEDKKPYYIATIKSGEEAIPSKLLLDTGNSDAVWVFTNKTDKIKLPEKNIQDYLGRGFSGNVFGKRARLNSFEFGKKTFNFPLVTFPDSSSVKSVNFVPNRIGSVGSEIISRFTIVFDYLNGAIYTKPNNKIKSPFNFNMSGIEIEHAGLEWVKETFDDRSAQGIKIYTDASEERVQNNLKVHFELKPIFKIASVRVGSEAEKSGLKVGDRILKINHQIAHGYTIEMINELLRSEEGKTIEIEIERDNKTYKFEFQLKKII